MAKLGNPAPLGLLAFGMTTMMLMYVEMGWAEKEFEQLVAGYAFFYGGIGQFLVAIFEIIQGSTFSFAVFGSFAFFWLGWALIFIESHRGEENTDFNMSSYPDGKTLWLIQWGVLSFCFWIVSLRKNMCLIITLGLLWVTFFLLAAATDTGEVGVRKAAGYVGFLTAIGAWYTGVAEIINEEWGRHVLPGLKPILSPERFEITKDSIVQRTQYDRKTNTMFLQFRGIQIKTPKDVLNIKLGVEEAFKAAEAPGEGKIHVVVDYEDVLISDDVASLYWETVAKIQQKWYLSAKRFHVSSFGTGHSSNLETSRMHRVVDNMPDKDATRIKSAPDLTNLKDMEESA